MSAAASPDRTPPVSHDDHGLALAGYDAVSYFHGQPLAGLPELASTHLGLTYLFASPANQQRFDAEPERFLPQYGGFCAVAVSEGKLVPVDPLTYKVSNEKLYLFYNGEHGNTRPQWEADEPGLRAAADERWAEGNLAPL